MFKKLTSLFLCTSLMIAMTSCAGTATAPASDSIEESSEASISSISSEAVESSEQSPSTPGSAERPEVNMMLVKGFLSIGAVGLFEDNENGASLNNYTITTSTAPDEISAKLLSGEADIAAVPTNMAAAVYNKSEGQVQIVAVNTLGVVKLISTDESIQSLEDLKGTTMLGCGQGAIPEYTFDYILKQNGIDPQKDLTLEYKPGHEEVSTLMSAGEISIATIPEPSATQVMSKNSDAKIVLDLTEEWNKLGTDAIISQGCVVVQKSLIEEHPDVVANFLKDYQKSCNAVHEDLEKTAELCEKFDIMKMAVAMTSIPKANQVYITGEEMKQGLVPFFSVLFEANPKSVGGALPDDDFYYIP